MKSRAKIRLEGVVQGVGFRPFIHRLSKKFGLGGFITNTSAGVYIEAEGGREALAKFYRAITGELPPLARITKQRISFCRPRGYGEFAILESRKTKNVTALISPDIGTCETCRRELSDPTDRRYRYPFTNCTDCGPRFSIIEGIPYDRPLTTMRRFDMCPRCRQEYESILSRRYHAQPNACPDCGPKVRLFRNGRAIAESDGAMKKTTALIANGAIIAVKGIGGYHIACDALNAAAIKKLRERKHRPGKPFAVMGPDKRTVQRYCRLLALEERLLFGPERPIVLLKKKPSAVLDRLSPDNNYLGVMAPYSPLHYLLFAGGARLLVMTSANEADEPVETDDTRAMAKLADVCDYFLIHDRPIANRCDDSIVQVMDGAAVILRRGRGYAPFPFLLPRKAAPTLACGAELKSTFCLAQGTFAFLSQYIGDLKTYPTFAFFKEAISKLGGLFAITPRLIACDLHPDYLSTKFAEELRQAAPGRSLVAVQHHEAHVAGVIAEHSIKGRVIGVCFDGTGYGADATAWGGEFFCGNLAGMKRLASFEPLAMPGGDKATQEPFRMAISCLYAAYGQRAAELDIGFVRRHGKSMPTFFHVMRNNPVITSSCGRLFDSVSALLGICDIITYEAQAAVKLQKLAETSASAAGYGFGFADGNPGRILVTPMIRELVADIRAGKSAGLCARKFHNGLAAVTADVCGRIRKKERVATVCLSGGVFQNRLFLETLAALLRKQGFDVFFNQLVPTNDGAVSLGQAMIANARK